MNSIAELTKEIERLTQALADKDLALMEAQELAQAANRQAEEATATERERAARLALQWSNARNPEKGGNSLRNFAAALRAGDQVDERPSDYHWANAAPQQHAQAANEDRQEEAHKLARILFGMVEGDGRVEGADIYAEGYSAPDGDVYVLRAAELLIEQAAEAKELTRYVETFALQANALKNATAPAQPIAGELPPLPHAPEEVAYGYKSNYDGIIREVLLHSGGQLVKYREVPLVTIDQMHGYARTYGHQCRAAALERAENAAHQFALEQLDPDRLKAALDCEAVIRALNKTEGA